jgi:hypothetical protein
MKIALPLALALALTALPAAAEQTAPPAPMGRGMMPVFADFDGNGDGSISEQEYVDARNKRIAQRASEGRPMRGLAQAEEFKDVDANGDGGISREEFEAHQRRHFQNRPMPPAR